jgi:hypothetical protein
MSLNRLNRNFKVSKGFGVNTSVKYNSPTQEVTINFPKSQNTIIPPILETVPIVQPPIFAPPPAPEQPIEEITDIEIVKTRCAGLERKCKQLESTNCEQNNIIDAMNLIIHIKDNNPLVIDNLVIADSDTLSELIRLLTGGDDVRIILKDDQSIGCGCCSEIDGFALVENIYVHKNNEDYSLKSHYGRVVAVFKDFRISLKVVST